MIVEIKWSLSSIGKIIKALVSENFYVVKNQYNKNFVLFRILLRVILLYSYVALLWKSLCMRSMVYTYFFVFINIHEKTSIDTCSDANTHKRKSV